MRRKHRFVYCCVIAGTCFDVTVLAWRKYATIYWCDMWSLRWYCIWGMVYDWLFVSVIRGRFLVLISVRQLNRPQGHRAAERIRSNKKCNGLIGIRTRKIPACNSSSIRTHDHRVAGVESNMPPRKHGHCNRKSRPIGSETNNIMGCRPVAGKRPRNKQLHISC
jgi:hypothetical protein